MQFGCEAWIMYNKGHIQHWLWHWIISRGWGNLTFRAELSACYSVKPSIYLTITICVVWHHRNNRIKTWGRRRQPVSPNRGPSESVQMVTASSLSQEWHCHHLSCVPLHKEQGFFISCFRCWAKQPRLRARTSARCIMGAIYQSHHALEALNTATVFCASLSSTLPSFSPLSLSLSAPLPLQLSLSNAW